MLNLPPNLLNECRALFSECDEFASDQTLAAVFTTPDLAPFKLGLPYAGTVRDRIDLSLSYLMKLRTSQGAEVLPLFMQALSERYEIGDGRRDGLRHLADEIRADGASRALPAAEAALPDQKALADYLNDNFSMAEIEALLYNLSQSLRDMMLIKPSSAVTLDDIEGPSKPAKVRNLIAYFSRRSWYPQLVAEIRRTDQAKQNPI